MTVLVKRYRCIGKRTGRGTAADAPTTTTAVLDEDAAHAAGVALLVAGHWSEFYVKEVTSLHRLHGSARMETASPEAPLIEPPGSDSPRPGGSVVTRSA